MVQLGGFLGNMGIFSDHINTMGSLVHVIGTFGKGLQELHKK